MSSKTPYYASKNKKVKVKCSICFKEMTRQSLVDHMRNVHKISSGSVREAGEGSIKDYFGKAGKIVRGNTDGSDVVIDDDATENVSRVDR